MLIYVAGPYGQAGEVSDEEISQNIEAAAEVSAKLWEMGHAVICPHTNTAHFEHRCEATWADYIEGDLNMLARCDAIVMLPNWRESKGATIEHNYAQRLDIPIYTWPDVPELHPTEVRCPIQARSFREITGRMYRIHMDKNADYGPANIMGTGEIGLVTRLWDKMARLMNLTGFRIQIAESAFEHSRNPVNESTDDTYSDMAVYSVIGLLLRHGAWGK